MYNQELHNFTTPIKLKIVNYVTKTGQKIKQYSDSDIFNASFKTKGGTEINSNNVLMIEDTAEVVCWYNPKITSECRIVNLLNNVEYEILGEPENIDFRYQYMKFKVKNYRGGA